MSRLNCIMLRCLYNNSFLSFIPLGFIQYYLYSRDCNDYTIQPFHVRCQSCFSLGSKTVYVLSSLLKSMMHASEFHSLFRGATQERLRNGLIFYAADCCSRFTMYK